MLHTATSRLTRRRNGLRGSRWLRGGEGLRPWRARAVHGSASRLLEAVRDAPAREVVRRDLDPDAVARQDANAVAAHLAGQVAELLVPVVQLDAEHQAG